MFQFIIGGAMPGLMLLMKADLVRFKTNKSHWKALNLIAFRVILSGQL